MGSKSGVGKRWSLGVAGGDGNSEAPQSLCMFLCDSPSPCSMLMIVDLSSSCCDVGVVDVDSDSDLLAWTTTGDLIAFLRRLASPLRLSVRKDSIAWSSALGLDGS
jgi:hypothetical protein